MGESSLEKKTKSFRVIFSFIRVFFCAVEAENGPLPSNSTQSATHLKRPLAARVRRYISPRLCCPCGRSMRSSVAGGWMLRRSWERRRPWEQRGGAAAYVRAELGSGSGAGAREAGEGRRRRRSAILTPHSLHCSSTGRDGERLGRRSLVAAPRARGRGSAAARGGGGRAGGRRRRWRRRRRGPKRLQRHRRRGRRGGGGGARGRGGGGATPRRARPRTRRRPRPASGSAPPGGGPRSRPRTRNAMAVSHLRAALSRILRSPSRLPTSLHAPPLVFPHRRLSDSPATASSSGSFAAEDYLVSRFGLTRAQALKAAAKLSHVRSRAKPDAVIAYLESTLGIPAADVGRVIVIDPSFLCSDVERTLAPRVADLRDLGLSRDEITRLVPLAPNSLRTRFLRGNLEFWLAELGSFDKLLQVLRRCGTLLCGDFDKVGRPNVAFLRQCGLNISEIAGTTLFSTRLFTMKPKLLKETVQRVEELGIDRSATSARVFRQALAVVAVTDKEAVARRIRLLHNIGFSKDDVLTLVRKQPLVLALSEQKFQGNVDFLMKDVGLEVSYIVRRPALLMYSVERRLLPRHCLIKALREKGLLKAELELDYYSTTSMAEKIFVEKFVHPFKDHVPGLTDDYASKCSGKATDGIAQ